MPIREIISSYDQPIVLGITPFTRSSIRLTETRSDWPPFRDADRLTRYDLFTALIENRPQDVFDDLKIAADQKEKIAIALALPELLCNVWADAVWDDPPSLELPTTKLDDAWTQIDEANDFSEVMGWESVFAAAGWGHSILKLRRDESRLQDFESDVVIEEIDPAIYFPILKPGSARDVTAVVLAWEEDRSDPDAEAADMWQVRELHEILNGAYTITRQERKPFGMLRGGDFRLVSTETVTDVDFLPFVDMHAKRWRGRYWGVSELSRQISIVDEIDNTLSNIAEILEYHGKPMLQLPASVIYGGTLTKGADKAIGIRRPEEADIARYVTYDGQISAQLEDLDRLVELAFLTAEVPRTYFGLGAETTALSGTALKLQLQNYLKKADRWQRSEKLRLRTLVPMALRLDGQANAKLGDIIPIVTQGSPLPADDEQIARIEVSLEAAGLSSRETSIRNVRRWSQQEVDDEITRIDDDKADSIGALPPALRASASGSAQPPQNGPQRPPNSSTNPNGGNGPAA